MLNPLPVDKNMSYSEMRDTVALLVDRMNTLNAITVFESQSIVVPRFNISETSAKLDLPSLSELLEKITILETAVNEQSEQLGTCESESSELQEILDALKALITPPEGAGGTGAWAHSTPTSVGCRFGDVKVSGSYTDQLSVEYVSGTDFKFTRVNASKISVDDNGVTVSVPGGIDFKVTTSPDPSATGISLSLSGNRGATSTDTVDLSGNTIYYVFARATNIVPSCGSIYSTLFELKGKLNITDPTDVQREFVITLTVDEEGNPI